MLKRVLVSEPMPIAEKYFYEIEGSIITETSYSSGLMVSVHALLFDDTSSNPA